MGVRARQSSASAQEKLDRDKPEECHDPVEWRPGIRFAPDFVRAGWRLRDARWEIWDIVVSGRRILKSGELGVNVERRWVLPHRAEQEVPGWARQWAADNRPDQLPWSDE